MNNLDHLGPSNYIDDIAMSLDEDMYGASGELSDEEIRNRLMESIVASCNYHISGHSGIGEDFIQMSVAKHEYEPALTLSQVAGLILRVWKHGDRRCMDAMQPLQRLSENPFKNAGQTS
jgi:hypothetical protein